LQFLFQLIELCRDLSFWVDSRSLRKYESPEEEFDMVHMDPTELTDSRPNDGPLAVWRNKIVLGVHHDGAGAMPREWKIVTDRLVLGILFGLTGANHFFEAGYTM
jgi:hypothetical protein